ncbi:uncharacterized protein [Arachis hypogaea]|uniref:uncharacterized protein n=1 Tax=Arachis hypogaea TaxID=3818 RepID=UPI000DEC7906|nr:uncharacterized protein LOC112704106 [Arachis hypogaea]QHO28514.1 uncharacterized protein DS421_7g217340 [Arachis hypogaea]
MHAEDMELMLMQACAYFQIESPNVSSSRDKLSGRSSDVWVHDRPSSQLQRFRAGCSWSSCTRGACSSTGGGVQHAREDFVCNWYTIRDYNRRILGRLEKHLRQSREEEVQALEERLHCLEVENEELREQVDIFTDMLEE